MDKKLAQSAAWKYQDLTRTIIGAFYDVRNTLGHGFLESVYENALAHELHGRGLGVIQQKPLAVAHRRQLYNYLRASDIEVGLVLNFGPEAELQRVILDNHRKPHHRQAK